MRLVDRKTSKDDFKDNGQTVPVPLNSSRTKKNDNRRDGPIEKGARGFQKETEEEGDDVSGEFDDAIDGRRGEDDDVAEDFEDEIDRFEEEARRREDEKRRRKRKRTSETLRN